MLARPNRTYQQMSHADMADALRRVADGLDDPSERLMLAEAAERLRLLSEVSAMLR